MLVVIRFFRGLESLLALPLSEIIMICRLYKLFDLGYIQHCGDLPAPVARVLAGDGGKVISLGSVVCKPMLNCL